MGLKFNYLVNLLKMDLRNNDTNQMILSVYITYNEFRYQFNLCPFVGMSS
jgi:hypothetical protein